MWQRRACRSQGRRSAFSGPASRNRDLSDVAGDVKPHAVFWRLSREPPPWDVRLRASSISPGRRRAGPGRAMDALMARPIRFGVTLPQIKRTWQEARAAAVEFERLGFDSVWVCDHLYSVPIPTLPIFEAWSELAAVAAITERVELGTLVTPPFFRNPAVLAKQVATIDHVANGRVIVGLGGGWFAAEFEAYGCPFPSLGARLGALEETAQVLRRLWTEERTTFGASTARCATRCASRSPSAGRPS